MVKPAQPLLPPQLVSNQQLQEVDRSRHGTMRKDAGQGAQPTHLANKCRPGSPLAHQAAAEATRRRRLLLTLRAHAHGRAVRRSRRRRGRRGADGHPSVFDGHKWAGEAINRGLAAAIGCHRRIYQIIGRRGAARRGRRIRRLCAGTGGGGTSWMTAPATSRAGASTTTWTTSRRASGSRRGVPSHKKNTST